MLAKHYLDRFNSQNLFNPFYSFTDFACPQTTSKFKQRINYDITSDDMSLMLTVDLPGVKKEDLQVEASGQTISVKAKRVDEDCSTIYKISKDYDLNQVDAQLIDGVLTLKFNRAKSLDTKQIIVK